MNLSENVVHPRLRRRGARGGGEGKGGIFIISLSGVGLTSFDKNNQVNIFGEKSNMIMIKI